MTAYDAYRDGEQAVLRPSAVLFLDLLGTANPRDEKEAAAHLAATLEALEEARDWGDSDPYDSTAALSWFSDNLGMAYPVTDKRAEDEALGGLAIDAANHQLALIDQGFASRGGISLGLFYADDHLLYGPALNDAVDLEKKAAVYPRVVLANSASEAARRHLIDFYGGSGSAPQRSDLVVDREGVVFVHYLATGLEFTEEEAPLSFGYLEKHRKFIVANIATYKDCDRVREKYRWLAAYHDWFLDSFRSGPLAAQAEELLVRDEDPLDVEFRPFAEDVPIPPEPS